MIMQAAFIEKLPLICHVKLQRMNENKKNFFFTDLLPFLSKPDKAIDKLKSNLDIFRESSQDVQLIWHPYSQTKEFMKINGCPVIKEYNKVISDIRKMKF